VILRNNIRMNDDLGISFYPSAGVTANDPDDADSGANNLQNWPELLTAETGSTKITGTLDSTPNRDFRLELFSSNNCDPSGNGEGRQFLGSATLHTDGDGEIDFAVQSPLTAQVGDFITATVTDTVALVTSEFSNCVEVEQGPTPSPSPTGPTPSPSSPTPTPTATPIPVDTPEPSAEVTDEPTPSHTPSPTPTPTPTLEPSETPTGTATATATASPTASPSPTPTPSATPDGVLRQGDVNCSAQAGADDLSDLLSEEADVGEENEPTCPDIGEDVDGIIWGDVDCDGDVDLDDALALLLWMAGLPYDAVFGCPEIGQPLPI
jgi:hypothetical protein